MSETAKMSHFQRAAALANGPSQTASLVGPGLVLQALTPPPRSASLPRRSPRAHYLQVSVETSVSSQQVRGHHCRPW